MVGVYADGREGRREKGGLLARGSASCDEVDQESPGCWIGFDPVPGVEQVGSFFNVEERLRPSHGNRQRIVGQVPGLLQGGER